MNTIPQYETVIGLEVHLQLLTNTKIFCSCANTFGKDPNSQTCPVCLGLPGTLPVLNEKALAYAIKIGLALNCRINSFIKFDRKNYYYPDLPKGYQISQFDLPIASDGHLMIPIDDGSVKKIRIKRGHLEEDAGKLIHDDTAQCSLVDYNRTGTPLLEIVTEPDLSSSQEAYDYLQSLKLTLQYLNVSDCDMEKGSLRCDANISIREKGAKALGTKAELKNMNSFKAVKTALDFEENRQQTLRRNGDAIVQETRLWDESKQMTFAMRSKEEAHDYRYFPEPDLVPFIVDDKTIKEIQKSLPELPTVKFDRLVKEYDIAEYDARILVQDPQLASFFEQCSKKYTETKKICNWINGPLLKEMHTRKLPLTDLKITPQDLVGILTKIDSDSLSQLAAKEVLTTMIETKKDLETVIQEKGLAQVSDESSLRKIVEEVIRENADVANQVREGQQRAIGFLIGQAMKKSQGKANPKKLGEILKSILET